MSRKIVSIAAAALVMATISTGPLLAAALDKDSCNRLKTEQDALEKAGVRTTMAKGPEWAKANLPPDKLEEVRRTIELDEQLLFRCAGKPLVVLPPEADPAAVTEDKKEDGEQKAAKPGAPPAPADDKASAQKKAAPQRKAAVLKEGVKADATEPGKAPGQETAAKPQPKPKPKPKAKPADDAYKPTPSDPANPFNMN